MLDRALGFCSLTLSPSEASNSSCPIFHARRNHMHRAAPTYMKPVNICAFRYLPPLACTSIRAMGSETEAGQPRVTDTFSVYNSYVHGRTSTIHVIESADGNSFKPTTSAPTGAMVVQKIPATVPTMSAKNTKTPNPFEKIQLTKQKRPQTNVRNPAMLMRPARSLKIPTAGRPRPCPRLRSAPMMEPW